jgi:CDP-glycerol glycerophosphotransferase
MVDTNLGFRTLSEEKISFGGIEVPKKEVVNYLKKLIMKGILHIFWIYPLNKNKIFLLNELSYSYGDSLKYIDQYLHNSEKHNYEVVYSVKEGCEGPGYDIIVRPNSFGYFKEILSSGTIITNAGGVSYLPKRKGQKVINTWHGGGPYKKTSIDVYNNYWYRKEVKMNCDNIDYILSSCKYFTEIEAKSMGFEAERCIPTGLPRNDILFGEHQDIVKKVRDFYSIPDGKKFILYAPTFRSDSAQSTSKMISKHIDLDVDMLLSALSTKYKCEWICGIRLHPKLADMGMGGMNVINCTTYPDMQELLCCADAIITDYSSLMWDYSFTYRPVFLYAPDIEQYEKERGFYMPVSEWPYPIAHDNEEMKKVIYEFDEAEYVRKVKLHHAASGSFEKGNACEILMQLIEKVQ